LFNYWRRFFFAINIQRRIIFHSSGQKILFTSNFEAESGFPFDLYSIHLNGKNLERVAYGETFYAFLVLSNNGKKLVFSSNRNNGGGRDTKLFIAEWQDYFQCSIYCQF
tara:strand:+ start:478 stop:804 length:327 start_codon:yes stop_codon:yes gene_type:complete